MTEGNVLPDHEPLELVEHRGVRCIGIFAEDFPRTDHAERRLVLLHVANLYSGSVPAEEAAIVGCSSAFHIEDVLIVACRMILWEIEEIEVVFLRIDLGSVRNIEAHAPEDFLHLSDEFGDEVEMSARRWREI